MIWICKNCGSQKIEEVQRGQRISTVVGVTLDNGLVCDLKTFVADVNHTSVFYRCTNCLTVLPFDSTDKLVEFLRKEEDKNES